MSDSESLIYLYLRTLEIDDIFVSILFYTWEEKKDVSYFYLTYSINIFLVYIRKPVSTRNDQVENPKPQELGICMWYINNFSPILLSNYYCLWLCFLIWYHQSLFDRIYLSIHFLILLLWWFINFLNCGTVYTSSLSRILFTLYSDSHLQA